MNRFLNNIESKSPRIIEFCLVGFIFLAPWEKTSGLKNVLLGTGVLVWALERYLFKKESLQRYQFLEKYIVFYILAVFISVFLSQNLLTSVRALRGDLSKFLLVYVLAIHIYHERSAIKRLFYGIGISSCLVTVYGLSGYFFNWSNTIEPGGLATGPFNHHNLLGNYLSVHILFLLYLFFSEKTIWIKIICWIMIPLHLFLLLLSHSRASLAALIIGSGSIFLMQKQIKTVFAFSLTLFVLFLGFVDNGVLDRFQTILDPNTYIGGIAGRDQIWKRSIERIMESPLFGHGYGANIFWKISHSNGTPEIHAHNLFMEVLFESGILGLIAYILMFFRGSWETYRYRNRFIHYPFLLSLFILIFFLSLTEIHFLQGRFGIFLWLAFALVTTTRDIDE